MLFDDLIKLKMMKNRMAFPLFFIFKTVTKKDLQIEFVHLRKNCQTLIQAIKTSNDESKNSKHYDDIKNTNFDLQDIAYEIIDFARRLDSLKPENIFSSDVPRVRAYHILFFSNRYKQKLIKDYELFLLKLCRLIKTMVSKIDNINDCDMIFAEYYLGVLTKNLKKERDFEHDIAVMTKLYKKIFVLIEYAD